MDYNDLLNDAYKNIKKVESTGRFEIPKVEGHIEGNKTIRAGFDYFFFCVIHIPFIN